MYCKLCACMCMCNKNNKWVIWIKKEERNIVVLIIIVNAKLIFVHEKRG